MKTRFKIILWFASLIVSVLLSLVWLFGVDLMVRLGGYLAKYLTFSEDVVQVLMVAIGIFSPLIASFIFIDK